MSDNQTRIGENHSAWRLEILNKDNGYKTYISWAINHDLGYRFIYSAPEGSEFGNFLNDFNKLLNSVKFVTSNATISKSSNTPSFLQPDNIEPNRDFSENTQNLTTTPEVTTVDKSKQNMTSPELTTVEKSNQEAGLLKIPELPNESNLTDTNDLKLDPKNIKYFKTYSDEDIGFSLRYPSDWTQDTIIAHSITVASFKSPDKDANVDIRIFPQRRL